MHNTQQTQAQAPFGFPLSARAWCVSQILASRLSWCDARFCTGPGFPYARVTLCLFQWIAGVSAKFSVSVAF
jgi:hypothetical protein